MPPPPFGPKPPAAHVQSALARVAQLQPKAPAAAVPAAHVRNATAASHAVQARPAAPAPRTPAPHVQAAVRSVQAKLAPPPPAVPPRPVAPQIRSAAVPVQPRPAPAAPPRAAAPHVQAAVAVQAKPASGPAPVAPHVRTAVAQAKAVGSPAPALAPRPPAPVLQRKIDDAALRGGDSTLKEAYRRLREAIQGSGTLAETYFHYAASDENGHDLIFKVINDKQLAQQSDHGKFLGKTTFVYRDDDSDVTDAFNAARAVKTGLNTVVVINTAHAQGTVEQYLQTLSHEIGVHALEWYDLIVNLVGAKDAEQLAEYYLREFTRDGQLSAVAHHDRLGRGESPGYNEIARALETYYKSNEELARKQDDIFVGSSSSAYDRLASAMEKDRYNHNEEEQRQDFEALLARVELLNTASTPLISRPSRQRPRASSSSASDKGCCCVLM